MMIMIKKCYPVVLVTAFIGMFMLASCDFSSMSDIKRAGKQLKKADDVNAEFWAEREYKKAQTWLNIAIEFNHERKINEARDAAQESYDWSIQAIDLSIKRAKEMEEEHDGINKKDY